MKLFMLIFIISISVSESYFNEQPQADIIARLNNGMIASPIQSIGLIVDSWLSTFEIRLPPKPSSIQYEYDLDTQAMKAVKLTAEHKWESAARYFANIEFLPTCATSGTLNSTSKDCPPYADLMRRFTEIHKRKLARHLIEIYETLEAIVPSMSRPLKRRRHRRSGWSAFLNFMGVASQEDLLIIYQNLQNLHKSTADGFAEFGRVTTQFANFMQLSTTHLQSVTDILNDQQGQIYAVSNTVQAANQFFLSAILHVVEYSDAQQKLAELDANLRQVYQGLIPPKLIEPRLIQRTAYNISGHLKRNNISLTLARKYPSQIYTMNQFTFSCSSDEKDTSIYITLEFPMSIIPFDLTLYKITALSMPIEPDRVHSSIILELPRYIAWSPLSDWYLEFDARPRIENGLYYLHYNPTALRHKKRPTCIMALLELGRDEIKRLCQFAIQPFKADPSVIVIAPGKLLLQFIANYTMHCQGQEPIVQTGCALCLIRLNCSCKFTAFHFQYYAQIAHCQNEPETSPEILYPVNLPYLERFFSNTTELLPEHNELLNYLPKILWPEIPIANRTQDLGILQHSLLDMDKVAQATKNQSLVFTALSDRIYYDLNTTKLNFEHNSVIETIEKVFVFLNPVISILAFLGFLYLYCRFQTITTALAIVKGTAQAAIINPRERLWVPDFYRDPAPASFAAVTVPPFNFTFNARNISFSDWISVDAKERNFRSSILTMLILLLMFFLLKHFIRLIFWCYPKLAKLCHTAKPENVEFKIILVLGDSSRNYAFNVRSIPYLTEHYEFKATQFISNLQVTGYLFPQLDVQWHDFSVTHKHAPLTYTMPAKIKLTFRQAFAIRKILHTAHYALLHTLDHKGQLSLLPIRGSRWDPNISSLQSPMATNIVANAPPLYPALPLRLHV
jgi:hypothetical protein